jgi:hypothetical protein
LRLDARAACAPGHPRSRCRPRSRSSSPATATAGSGSSGTRATNPTLIAFDSRGAGESRPLLLGREQLPGGTGGRPHTDQPSAAPTGNPVTPLHRIRSLCPFPLELLTEVRAAALRRQSRLPRSQLRPPASVAGPFRIAAAARLLLPRAIARRPCRTPPAALRSLRSSGRSPRSSPCPDSTSVVAPARKD